MALQTESRNKLHQLIALLQEVDRRCYGPEWNIEAPADVSDGHRALMHVLQGGLYSYFEADPERPRFRRVVSPTRKFRGDNPDAVYFDAVVHPEREYVVRGNLAGAVYVSLTVEEGPGEGAYATGTAAGLNNGQFESDARGNFELLLSARKPADAKRARNWLRLSPTACAVTTRHYFENEQCAAADPALHIPLSIAPLQPPGPPPAWDDARVAAGITRVMNFVRGDTLGRPPGKPENTPRWVSTVPNQFPQPEKPGDLAFSAMDIAYSMAPYLIGPEQALVISGRFPQCRFANVNLWNRYLQSYDYAHRQVSLNRKQTQLDADGNFRMIIAHKDPGAPNWLDSEGRPFGMVYWRFLLPEGAIETPQTELVQWDEIAQ